MMTARAVAARATLLQKHADLAMCLAAVTPQSADLATRYFKPVH
jgi:hypothetical protein